MKHSPPKRVRVGHRFYKVALLPQPVMDDGTECDGLCVFYPAQIQLASYLEPDALAEKFIHEVLHACHHEAQLTDDSTEEDFTNLTAKALCRFWQDNPKAVAWWQASLRPPKDNPSTTNGATP